MVGMIGAVLGSAAQSYRLEGTIGGKIPIVIEMEDYEENLLGGRYAYKSTLDKYGDVDCSWLVIDENYDVPESEWTVFDCKKQPVEVWYNLNFMDRKHLTAWMTNKAGKTYQVVAHVVSPAVSKESLVPYYKQHIGEMVCDFDMFNEPRVKSRLVEMMGESNYNALKKIYQTQGDIEYSKGMFWGGGLHGSPMLRPGHRLGIRHLQQLVLCLDTQRRPRLLVVGIGRHPDQIPRNRQRKILTETKKTTPGQSGWSLSIKDFGLSSEVAIR